MRLQSRYEGLNTWLWYLGRASVGWLNVRDLSAFRLRFRRVHGFCEVNRFPRFFVLGTQRFFLC